MSDRVAHELSPRRRAYVHVVRGEVAVNGVDLEGGDAVMLENEATDHTRPRRRRTRTRPRCCCSIFPDRGFTPTTRTENSHGHHNDDNDDQPIRLGGARSAASCSQRSSSSPASARSAASREPPATSRARACRCRRCSPQRTILVELGGGILLVLGWKARWAALAIAVFTVLAAFLFHNYWTYAEPERMAQYINFWKNIAIAGGMLMVFAFGPGRYGVDRG